MSTTADINLADYLSSGSKVFTGRDRGIEVRRLAKIDELIEEGHTIRIIVPAIVRSINPSFLEEFLRNSVHKLGKQVFFERIIFVENGKYRISDDVTEAVDRLLRGSDNAIQPQWK